MRGRDSGSGRRSAGRAGGRTDGLAETGGQAGARGPGRRGRRRSGSQGGGGCGRSGPHGARPPPAGDPAARPGRAGPGRVGQPGARAALQSPGRHASADTGRALHLQLPCWALEEGALPARPRARPLQLRRGTAWTPWSSGTDPPMTAQLVPAEPPELTLWAGLSSGLRDL